VQPQTAQAVPAAETPDTPGNQAPPAATAPGAAVTAPVLSEPDGPTVAPAATTAAEGAAPSLAVSGPEAAGSARRLAFELSGDSWVEVTGADGNRQFRAMLHAGDTRTLVGKGPWRVLIGKADVVRVTLDGALLSPGPEFRRGDTALYNVDQHGTLY
jgi:cytoskeleton protein RodZ